MPRRASPEFVHRSACPIASALDLIGDRWTLLILRDLFLEKSKYGEFLESKEGIPTNILAERLVRLQKLGLIDKTEYQSNPPRFAYALTEKGKDLRQVLGALAMWGKRYVPSSKMNETLRAKLQQKPA